MVRANISSNIRDIYGISCKKFCEKHDIDYYIFNALIYNQISGTVKNTKAYQIRKKLIELNVAKDEDFQTTRKKQLKDFHEKDSQERKKLYSLIYKKYGWTLKDYYNANIDYFKKHNISLNSFYIFTSGVSYALKKNSHQLLIRKKLESDNLLKPFPSNSQED